MAKGEPDLVEQAKHNKSQAQQRAKALPLMDRGFMTEPAAAAQRVRTQPGDAQQVNDSHKNIQNGSPSALPTRFAKGGPVGKHDDAAADKKLFKKMFKQEESTEAQGMKKGGKKAFNPGGQKGKLHRELGVPEGQKIPSGRLASAANSSNPEVKRDAIRAQTMKQWKHADGGQAGVPRNKVAKMAVGGVAKIRHEEMTKDQKQTPNKPSGWNAYK